MNSENYSEGEDLWKCVASESNQGSGIDTGRRSHQSCELNDE